MSHHRIARRRLTLASLAAGALLGLAAEGVLAQFVGPLPLDVFNPRQTLNQTEPVFVGPIQMSPTTQPSALATGDTALNTGGATELNTADATTASDAGSPRSVSSPPTEGAPGRPPVRDPFRPPTRSPFRP